MLLESLIARGRASNTPLGYSRKTVPKARKKTTTNHWIVSLSRTGRFLSIRKAEEGQVFILPKLVPNRTSNSVARTACDQWKWVFGTEVRTEGVFLQVLDQIPHPAAVVIGRFLRGPLPTPPLTAKISDEVVFEVEGFPEWWMNPVVINFHRERVSTLNTSHPFRKPGHTCSLCGGQGIMARTIPEVLGNGTISSFNQESWCGYGIKPGKTGGLNVPTCMSCALAIPLGLESLLFDHSSYRVILLDPDTKAASKWAFWWAEGLDVDPWKILEAATKGDEEALEAIPDGHFFLAECNQGRFAVHTYMQVQKDEVRKRVREWVAAFRDPTSPWTAASAIAQEGAGKNEIRQTLAELYNHLLTGLPLGSLAVRATNRILKGNFSCVLKRSRRQLDLYHYAGGPHFKEDQMNGISLCVYNVGRAFSRADWLQIARKRPRKTLRFTHGNHASTHLSEAFVLASKHGVHHARTVPQPDGTTKTYRASQDNRVVSLLTEAAEAVDGDIPSRLRPHTRAYFWMGFHAQRKDDEARALARRESRGVERGSPLQ